MVIDKNSTNCALMTYFVLFFLFVFFLILNIDINNNKQ